MADTDAAARGRIATGLLRDIEAEAGSIVPWFYDQMPEYYFLSHDEQDVRRHLRALISGQVLEEGRELSLSGPGAGKRTYITPGGDMSRLTSVLARLKDQDIRTARIYETGDRKLRLDTFLFSPQCSCDTQSEAFASILGDVLDRGLVSEAEMEDFRCFLSSASEDYIQRFETGRALRHFHTWRGIRGTERVHVQLEKEVYEGLDRVMVSMNRPPKTGLLLLACRIFARAGVDVQRAYGDVFSDCDKNETAVLSFYLRRGERALAPDSEEWADLQRDLSCLKWFAPHDLEALADEDGYSLSQVMLVQAACEFAHQYLQRSNIYAYSSDRIVRAALKHRDVIAVLLRYFDARFLPCFGGREIMLDDAKSEARKLLASLASENSRAILGCMFRFVRYIKRTNYYAPNRFGLSFRLDPALFSDLPRAQRPFGVYFFHGPFSLGFHVRYRDMSRGGVRIVPTPSQERFEIESNRLFDEAVKLASAQQFKNKDIPEGGSKAVLLLGPKADRDIALACMVDGLLDLIVAGPDGALAPEIVDHLGREEIIYLGPDENVEPRHIEWIVERARKRGYKWPCSLMSSKPKTGINHKEYGVTSEGVVVFAEQALISVGLDPRTRPFSVKFTGGPAGDVASNCMRILRREFGENVRIAAMADGHGAAFDPDGLDAGELQRLIDKGLRADSFNRNLLKGAGAFVASASTPEGARLRDDLHNKARTDLFIPAGGRPDTINDKNWRAFLDADGRPSARVVVEGANIFISPGARRKLEDAGALVVPGPSANKTGVICSSYEILAGLSLTDEEFLSIKSAYVQEVLAILRRRALDEARVILGERRLRGAAAPLSVISQELSVEINALGDAIRESLEREGADPSSDPQWMDQVRAYCPPVLAQRFGDRAAQTAPKSYLLSLLAASIASRMVYREGLGFMTFLAGVRPVREVVHAFLAEEGRVDELTAEVLRMDCSDRLALARIVESQGLRRLMLERLGLL
jgi:glutamate dehydrogenase